MLPKKKSAQAKRRQKQKAEVTSFGLLTPPDSGSLRRTVTPKPVSRQVSKKGTSDFRVKLAAAAVNHKTPTPQSSSEPLPDDAVHIIGTQINVKHRAMKHTWETEERQCLVLLRRFFIADIIAITSLLNAVFPKALAPFKSNMVGIQYTEIASGKKSNEDQDEAWSYVWSLDFDAAQREFDRLLEKLEKWASEAGVAITRRVEESQRNIIQANSRLIALQERLPRTPRRIIEKPNPQKRLVRQASATASQRIESSSLSPSSRQTGRQQEVARDIGTTVATDLEQNDTPDFEVPTLLFRAYSSESAGKNGLEGFRAALFTGRPNKVPPPLDPTIENFAWHAADHLSPRGDIANHIPTPFISLSPSLVWCVQRLYKLGGDDESKGLAIIDGPLADAKTRIFKTGPIMSQLKRTGMYKRGVKYQAKLEYFAWAEVDREAISTVVTRDHLEALSEGSAAVKSVLRLDILRNANSVKDARTQFIADPVPLDGQVGMAIGNLCLLFGISFHSDQAIVTELIYHILQGWAIKIDVSDGEAIQQAFSSFIGQLEKNDCSIVLATAISVLRPKMRDAFERGVQQAAQALLKDVLPRPDRRKRFNRRAIYERT